MRGIVGRLPSLGNVRLGARRDLTRGVAMCEACTLRLLNTCAGGLATESPAARRPSHLKLGDRATGRSATEPVAPRPAHRKRKRTFLWKVRRRRHPVDGQTGCDSVGFGTR